MNPLFHDSGSELETGLSLTSMARAAPSLLVNLYFLFLCFLFSVFCFLEKERMDDEEASCTVL